MAPQANFSALRKRAPWTPLEKAIWAVALVVTITVAILAAVGLIGDWALFIGCVIIMAVSLMRWRAETKSAEPDAGDHRSD